MSGRSAYVRKKITASDHEVFRATSSHDKRYGSSSSVSFHSQSGPYAPLQEPCRNANPRRFRCPSIDQDPNLSFPFLGYPSSPTSSEYPAGFVSFPIGAFPAYSDSHTPPSTYTSASADQMSIASGEPGRAHRPTYKPTEDVGLTERPDQHTAKLSSRSDKMRKGLAKTFGFGRRDKTDPDVVSIGSAGSSGNNPEKSLDYLPLRGTSQPSDQHFEYVDPDPCGTYHGSGFSWMEPLPHSSHLDGSLSYSNPHPYHHPQSDNQHLHQHSKQQAPYFPRNHQSQYQQQLQYQHQLQNQYEQQVSGFPPSSRGRAYPPAASESSASSFQDIARRSPHVQGDGAAVNTLTPAPQTPPLTPVKRWVGYGCPVQRWSKLRKDPEIWDPSGDVLIYLGHRGQSPKPPPSFRLSSHIIEVTESRVLVNMLRDGCSEHNMPSPPTVLISRSPSLAQLQEQHHRGKDKRLAIHHPTSPAMEDVVGDTNGEISYELFFATPPNLSRVDQLRHQITTRNVFALLCRVSIVGISLYQALTDLHARLQHYIDPEATISARDLIINYLCTRGIDDVRSDTDTAVSLMAWAEEPSVQWEEGWREGFMHCVGMSSQIELCADWKYTAPISRALLERAVLEVELRVQSAEQQLLEFQLGEMWPENSAVAVGPARACAVRLQRFLIAYYSRHFGRWPPLANNESAESPHPNSGHSKLNGIAEQVQVTGSGHGEDGWLTRMVVQLLQRDFGALYDFLVDRNKRVCKGDDDLAAGKAAMDLERNSHDQAVSENTLGLPLTDMLMEFDKKKRFPHIPHPFPLLPVSIMHTTSSAGTGGAGSVFHRERRVQLAYTEASNMEVLGLGFVQSELVNAYARFEKADHPTELDPALARQARWTLIYSILQTLATVSVDMPGLGYRDDVPYHLSLRLRGTRFPPWKSPVFDDLSSSQAPRDSAHDLSHCWLAPLAWENGDHQEAETQKHSDRQNSQTRRQQASIPVPTSVLIAKQEPDIMSEQELERELEQQSKRRVDEEPEHAHELVSMRAPTRAPDPELEPELELGPEPELEPEPEPEPEPEAEQEQEEGIREGKEQDQESGRLVEKPDLKHVTAGSSGKVRRHSKILSSPLGILGEDLRRMSLSRRSSPSTRSGTNRAASVTSAVSFKGEDAVLPLEESPRLGRRKSQESVDPRASIHSGETFGYNWLNDTDFAARRRDFSVRGSAAGTRPRVQPPSRLMAPPPRPQLALAPIITGPQRAARQI